MLASWICWVRWAARDASNAAVACFATALEALPRIGASPAVVSAVAGFADRYVARGRCPADDLLAPLPGKEERS